ncbi:deoxyuridine 5'-triphosphate nucleotidohydrolase [Bacillus rossius redtenbacheri]|uniref:deoxyuridine 5'-triphosphate nucleotidohydrolase n=1 Tax=Bacillus rossius redtenbacheri TaxID=93214 RepID=UPI002FDCE967
MHSHISPSSTGATTRVCRVAQAYATSTPWDQSLMPTPTRIPRTPTRLPTCGAATVAAKHQQLRAYEVVVPPRGKQLVKTDIQIELPPGCYGRIAPRSGLAYHNHIDVGAGVIDEDYRGNVGVLLFNHSEQPFVVKRGDRIAQLICQRIFYPDLVEVEDLSDTERGENGFGSTGKN